MKIRNVYDDIYVDSIPLIIIKTKKDLSKNKNIKIVEKFEDEYDNHHVEYYKTMIPQVIEESFPYSLFDDTGKIKFEDKYENFIHSIKKLRIKTILKSLFGKDFNKGHVSFNTGMFRISNKDYEVYFAMYDK